MSKFFDTKNKIAVIVLVPLLVFIIYNKSQESPQSEVSVTNKETYILEVIRKCVKQGSRNDCFGKIASDLTNNFKPEEIFAVIESNESSQDIFGACHSTLHFVGRELYKDRGNVGESLNVCSSTCFQGCYHGVIEEYLHQKKVAQNNLDEIKSLIPSICGKPSDFKKEKLYDECLHGLGHATMFLTDQNLPTALALCDTLDTNDKKGWCYSGAFMENSTSSTNRDHPSKFIKGDDPLYPCTILDKKYLTMCYNLQGIFVYDTSQGDLEEIIETCNTFPSEYRHLCFNAIGQGLIGHTQSADRVASSCLSLPNYVASCLEGAIGASAERYSGNLERAYAICNASRNFKEECLHKLESLQERWR